MFVYFFTITVRIYSTYFGKPPDQGTVVCLYEITKTKYWLPRARFAPRTQGGYAAPPDPRPWVLLHSYTFDR